MSITNTIQCQNCFASLDTQGAAGNVIRCGYCHTDNVLSSEVKTVVAENTHAFKLRLVTVVSSMFDSYDELGKLTFRYGQMRGETITLDNIPGSSASGKARELVLHAGRRSALQQLVDALLTLRPDVDLTT